MNMMKRDLSEPYPIYTYRYFVQQWPQYTLLAIDSNNLIVGAVVSKLAPHSKPGLSGPIKRNRGYIAMLSVEPEYRRCGLGKDLVTRSIDLMVKDGADEIMLETEVTNLAALGLYESLGFIRDKRLCAYYLNGIDAYRLKLIITPQI